MASSPLPHPPVAMTRQTLLALAAFATWLALALAASLAGGPLGVWAFLPTALPIAIWVAWNDMAHMKIPNMAVLALLAAFALTGPFVLPLAEYGWRWVHVAVVLVIGFLLNLGRLIGAGDAKFAAAMAPFFALDDMADAIRLFAAVLLAAFVLHRTARALPAVRRRVPDWASWEREDFPMGLALGGVLAFHLVLAALQGR